MGLSNENVKISYNVIHISNYQNEQYKSNSLSKLGKKFAENFSRG